MTAITEATERIRRWGEARDWRGYDPYDGLNSPLAPLLTLRTAVGRRILTQAVKLSPLNLRPLLGIRPAWNAKGLGLVASAYARLAAAGDESASPHAQRWLTWLVENHSGGDHGFAWGYHFDVQTRVFAYPRGTPNTIATSFVAQALLDGCELLGEERWRAPALGAARFLEHEMLEKAGERHYFRYLGAERELVHNANLLACAVLVRAARVLEEAALLEPVAPAVATTLAAQHPDGSWPYADKPGHDWVDNFHTGYVLESLAECESILPEVAAPLRRGLDFWQRELFLPDGTPKYLPGRVLPVDAHCYAAAIETWLSVADRHPRALERAERIAGLLIDRMLDASGYVYFQRRRLWTSKVPFIRWSTAPSLRALAGLALAHSLRQDPSVRLETGYAHLA